MILNVSGRTDIVGFYSKWFMNRYKEGFLDVRNPFNRALVSRIYSKDVDLIVFCTKNPLPIIEHLKEIDKPIIFQVTLTPYESDFEPHVPPKTKIIEGIKEVSRILGKDNLYVRYDPIVVNEKYSLEYHRRAFAKLTSTLDGYVTKYIISFVDNYKNVERNANVLKIKELNESDYKFFGENFSSIASKHKATVQTCFESHDLVEYGFIKGECVSKELAYKLTGKEFKSWKARKCNCVEMVDIGDYNSCLHLCKYCYANYDEKNVLKNNRLHDSKSSLLIGHIKDTDIIKVREK